MNSLTPLKNRIKDSFNRAAGLYDHYCDLQNRVGHRLISMIKDYRSTFSTMIDLGCGTGIITEELANTFSYQHCYAADIAQQLLIKARKRLRSKPILFLEDDFDSLVFSNNADLIFSNMSLQWSADLDFTLHRIAYYLHPQGSFAFSVPLEGTFYELKDHCNSNHFENLQAIQNKLYHAGFDLISFRSEKIILPFDTLRDALKSIKAIGANCTFYKKNFHFNKNLRKKLSHDDKTTLTYKIGYFIAEKIK